MELYERILCDTIAKEVLPALRIDSQKLVEMKCYQLIQKIHEIVSDDTLDDPECFWRIEQIICALEEFGIDGGRKTRFWIRGKRRPAGRRFLFTGADRLRLGHTP